MTSLLAWLLWCAGANQHWEVFLGLSHPGDSIFRSAFLRVKGVIEIRENGMCHIQPPHAFRAEMRRCGHGPKSEGQGTYQICLCSELSKQVLHHLSDQNTNMSYLNDPVSLPKPLTASGEGKQVIGERVHAIPRQHIYPAV